MKRKIIAGILAATTMLSVLSFFTGCGGGNTSSTTTKTTSTSPASTGTTIKLNTTLTMPDSLNPSTLPNSQVQRITANDLATMMNNHEKFVIVDTRDAAAYGLGHVTGAIDMSSYPPGAPYINQLITLPKDELIIFYCK